MPFRGKSYNQCKVSYNKRVLIEKGKKKELRTEMNESCVEVNLKEKQKRKTIPTNEYYVNDSNGIWLCPLVLKGKQKCQYGLCSNCYIKKAPKKRRRVIDKRGKVHGEICHHGLVMNFTNFFDSGYFTKNYKAKNSFVTNCGMCKVQFVS